MCMCRALQFFAKPGSILDRNTAATERDQAVSLELIQRLCHRLPVCADHVGELLMRRANAFSAIQPEQHRGESRRDAKEGERLNAGLAGRETLAEYLEHTDSDLGLARDQSFNIVTTHDADQALFDGFGKSLVHPLAHDGHLPEEGARAYGGYFQLLPIGRGAIELDSPALQDEEHFGFVALVVDKLARLEKHHLCGVFESQHLIGSQIAEDVDFPQKFE